LSESSDVKQRLIATPHPKKRKKRIKLKNIKNLRERWDKIRQESAAVQVIPTPESHKLQYGVCDKGHVPDMEPLDNTDSNIPRVLDFAQ